MGCDQNPSPIRTNHGRYIVPIDPFFRNSSSFCREKNSSQTVRESSAFSGILDRFKNRGTEALKPWCFKFHTIISLWKTPVLKASLHDFRSFGPHCLILAFVISQFCVSSYLFWPPSPPPPPKLCVLPRGGFYHWFWGSLRALKTHFPILFPRSETNVAVESIQGIALPYYSFCRVYNSPKRSSHQERVKVLKPNWNPQKILHIPRAQRWSKICTFSV